MMGTGCLSSMLARDDDIAGDFGTVLPSPLDKAAEGWREGGANFPAVEEGERSPAQLLSPSLSWFGCGVVQKSTAPASAPLTTPWNEGVGPSV